ncbi:MAG: type IV pilin protein [Burkholderiaceae bacterium]
MNRIPSLARARGFTLIEVTIAVAMAGVLSSVALPSFEGQLQRVRRTDALVAMMQIQSSQERFRSNAMSYGNLSEIGAASVSPSRHYTLTTTANSGLGYEVLATASGTQARDTACRVLKLSALGGTLVQSSGADASTGNGDATNRKCWLL